jgi:hypothetical protein
MIVMGNVLVDQFLIYVVNVEEIMIPAQIVMESLLEVLMRMIVAFVMLIQIMIVKKIVMVLGEEKHI